MCIWRKGKNSRGGTACSWRTGASCGPRGLPGGFLQRGIDYRADRSGTAACQGGGPAHGKPGLPVWGFAGPRKGDRRFLYGKRAGALLFRKAVQMKGQVFPVLFFCLTTGAAMAASFCFFGECPCCWGSGALARPCWTCCAAACAGHGCSCAPWRWTMGGCGCIRPPCRAWDRGALWRRWDPFSAAVWLC